MSSNCLYHWRQASKSLSDLLSKLQIVNFNRRLLFNLQNHDNSSLSISYSWIVSHVGFKFLGKTHETQHITILTSTDIRIFAKNRRRFLYQIAWGSENLAQASGKKTLVRASMGSRLGLTSISHESHLKLMQISELKAAGLRNLISRVLEISKLRGLQSLGRLHNPFTRGPLNSLMHRLHFFRPAQTSFLPGS